MKTNIFKIFSILSPIILNISIISIIFYGCHYCSPEGDEMRPLNEISNEVNELEKRKKSDEMNLKDVRKYNKQKNERLF